MRFARALLLSGAAAGVMAAAAPAALASSAEAQLRRALDTVAEGRLGAAIEGLDRLIDATRSRIYVYENDRGEPRLVADYYSTLGKRGIDKLCESDQKTPLGVYHVTSYARAPRASDGCIALANDEIAELAKRVRPGATPRTKGAGS